MASLSEILQIITLVRDIITALSGMGLKVNGEVHIDQILALIPKP
jgi:Na+-translocating ferredoxin:NAD+ oxidoreductase RNF subunit RnfB